MFERHMDYLHRNGYQCLGLGEAVSIITENRPQPKRSFVLTFDDGFRDLYTTVWPILDRYGFTATIFFVAGCAGQPSNWEGQSGPMAAPLMTWAEARDMVEAGFTFASHTVSHPRLPTLDRAAARREIQESKHMLEDQLGAAVDFFSYPYSAHDDAIRQMVAESGYTAACGGDRGTWGVFNLWRAQCGSHDNNLSFALKARGTYYHFFRLRQQPLLRKTVRYPVRMVKHLTDTLFIT
jgi:peptidoglycan/xylan/chitin deacetylase (PgdA/CDA1 family)